MDTTPRNATAADVEARIKSWAAAVHSCDIDRIMAHYAPDVVAFDAIQALQFKGRPAYREHWKMCIEMCGNAITMNAHELDVKVDGDLAVAHALFCCGPGDNPSEAGYARMTASYQRTAGEWLITHEHFSLPFDVTTGRALMELRPDGAGAASVKPIPLGMNTVTPHLVCAGAADAIDFYKKAFGAQEETRLAAPDGKIMHACLRFAGCAVFLVDEMPQCTGSKSPNSLGGTPVTLHLYVPDADAAMKKAADAGCTVLMPAQDMFWGDRYGLLKDPWGHMWSVATHTRDLSPDEIARAGREMMAQMGGQAAK